MEKLIINGQKKLCGEVSISGAKNAAVAILPAAIMADDICFIDNLPCIEDVTSLFNTLTKMGAKCEFLDKHTLKIDSRNIENVSATYEEVRKIRASYYLLGALLGRFKKAEVAMPGGCNFGSRPIDLHLKGFRALGAEVFVDDNVVKVYAEKLHGASIYMDQVSVGATINIMLAACLAEGNTVIENAAKEPHVVDTANFLNIMGAKIKGAGTDVIRITGVPKLHGAEYTIIPDQIEAGTYMIAAAITGGDVVVKNIIPKHMDCLSAKLEEMNVTIEEGDDSIRVISDRALKNVNVKTMSYPGFPTDLQPQMAALLTVCMGENIITENVWDNRYQYIDQLKKMGADISIEGRVARINGVPELVGTDVCATDLRAGAAMIIAGLAARGTTEIKNVKYIDRGYEDVENKFGNLGADIKRVK
ncbi:UDP-N-acetylglucosamine 1-carboxyvinyltransferase [Tyzzerella sp. An114]|mgnify:CR=1 FL=1|uniref:UDP-N-acetylglucosamine 1-carboxyvinyltransferase n=1 Tax=Tyzzerella sp. An114 TaxID=1965545 RepID=UPI000B450283|nr:UDP-N-acetylglucosamine 1-carboxyvinyltransferase [Tyzzerella sp. An114]OUQ56630.1 UDP-N-acetylglucosamine 1-carboxyvinyltransferase [Tyzzerella sp. An114]HIT73004.1 UDP-N-acetylglucosamine 1-carboxyvinyltransferase [Candidatus Fimicola cottocaccae]